MHLLQRHLLYVKPVQTGYPQDSDAKLVVSHEHVCRSLFTVP